MFAIVRLMLALALPPDLAAVCAATSDPADCQEELCRVTAIDYSPEECNGLADSLRVTVEDCSAY